MYQLNAGENIFTRLAGMRLLSVMIAVATVVCAYGAARALWPEQTWLPLAVATLVSFQPLFTFYTATLTNAALEILCYAALTWQAIIIMRRGMTWRRGATLGGILTAGLLTKSSFLPALLLVALLLVWDVLRTQTPHSHRRVADRHRTACGAGWLVVRRVSDARQQCAGRYLPHILRPSVRAAAAVSAALSVADALSAVSQSMVGRIWHAGHLHGTAGLHRPEDLDPGRTAGLGLARAARLAYPINSCVPDGTDAGNGADPNAEPDRLLHRAGLSSWRSLAAPSKFRAATSLSPLVAQMLLLVIGWTALLRGRRWVLLALCLGMIALNTYALLGVILPRYYGEQIDVRYEPAGAAVALSADETLTREIADPFTRIDVWLRPIANAPDPHALLMIADDTQKIAAIPIDRSQTDRALPDRAAPARTRSR